VLFLTAHSPIALIIAITVIFGITLGTGASGNQTALYLQASASQVGTASGLFRTFGYVGSIASSAIISIVFHASVTDHGLHTIAIVMIAASALALIITLADRQLRTPARDPAVTASQPPGPDSRAAVPAQEST
jgi:predicted MFS family arabinose efflux permease